MKRQIHPKAGELISLDKALRQRNLANDFLWKISRAGVFSVQQAVKPAAPSETTEKRPKTTKIEGIESYER